MVPELFRKFFSGDINLEGSVKRRVMMTFLSSGPVWANEGKAMKVK